MDMERILSGKPIRPDNSMPEPECSAGQSLLPELGGGGWMKQARGIVTLTDANKDGAISKDELVASYESQPSNCNKRIVASMLKHFELISQIAPESIEQLELGQLDLGSLPSEALSKKIGESLVDTHKNADGISLKDLTVGELVLNRPQFLAYLDEARKLVDPVGRPHDTENPGTIRQLENQLMLRRRLLLSIKNNS